jgi:hypothetical protein
VLVHRSAYGCHGAALVDYEVQSEIIHTQRDEPLLEFPDVPVFLPVPDLYASLTPTELAAFAIDPARVSDDEDDEEQANNDEETEDDE